MRVGIDVSPLVQTRAGTARYIEQLLEHLPGIERLSFGGSGRASTVLRDAWWYPIGLPVRARGLDVLHCPTFRAPLRSPVPLVITVHDLAVLRHPGTFNQWSRRYSRLGVPPERIRVIPNGVAEVFRPEGPAAAGEYVLAVGTLEPRKNLAAAGEAA